MKRFFESPGWLVLLLVVAAVVPHLIAPSYGPLLPEKLGRLFLQRTLSGDAARGIVDRMHGKAVSEKENSIGYYDGPVGDAVLYATVYYTPGEASRVERLMADRIASGSSVFGHFRFIEVREQRVAICYGLGQTHFFLARGRVLYWLAVENEL
ncbi:MAG: hypothetical protein KAJ12_05650, partial [Bacteroidetes bacterium]|nr:hypothetical protein [Bacteroidota bacterium]